jgi:hypothetical protein
MEPFVSVGGSATSSGIGSSTEFGSIGATFVPLTTVLLMGLLAVLIWVYTGKKNRPLDTAVTGTLAATVVVADNLDSYYSSFARNLPPGSITNEAGRIIHLGAGRPDLLKVTQWQPAYAKGIWSAKDITYNNANAFLRESPEAAKQIAGVSRLLSIGRASGIGALLVVGLDWFKGRTDAIPADLSNVFITSAVALACGPLGWAALGISFMTSLFLSYTEIDKKVAALVGDIIHSGGKTVMSIGAGVWNGAKNTVKGFAKAARDTTNIFLSIFGVRI